jgi:hypothetical protein
VRRLFSTFARGWPAAGLLLMRLAAGFALIAQTAAVGRPDPTAAPSVLALLAVVTAVLLIAGLWTPATGLLVAILGLANVAMRRGDPLTDILVGSMGAALALLGPGAWSVDAYLFGWRRVQLRDRNTTLGRGVDSTD